MVSRVVIAAVKKTQSWDNAVIINLKRSVDSQRGRVSPDLKQIKKGLQISFLDVSVALFCLLSLFRATGLRVQSLILRK